MEYTLPEWWYITPCLSIVFRDASSFARRMSLVLYAAYHMVPSWSAMLQPTQNVRPTGAIVVSHHRSGRIGLGPSWFVFFGGLGGVEQVSCEPHPKFLPFRIRFTSSLHSGPFSVSHRYPVTGSKLNP